MDESVAASMSVDSEMASLALSRLAVAAAEGGVARAQCAFEGAWTTARGLALAGVEEGVRGYLASMVAAALLYHSSGATS